MPRKGQQHTVWARDKISRELTGRKLSEEHKRNMSKARMGHEVSAATRKKMSETHKDNIRKAKLGLTPTKKAIKNMKRGAQRRAKRKRWSKRLNGLNPFRESQ